MNIWWEDDEDLMVIMSSGLNQMTIPDGNKDFGSQEEEDHDTDDVLTSHRHLDHRPDGVKSEEPLMISSASVMQMEFTLINPIKLLTAEFRPKSPHKQNSWRSGWGCCCQFTDDRPGKVYFK